MEQERGRFDAYRRGQLAAATALAGEPVRARTLLDETLARARLPELLANRGALHAALGDAGRAAVDLHDALVLAPELFVARLNLAHVLAQEGRAEDARRELAQAAASACRAPRGYPQGVGTGEVLEWGVGRRWLLLLGDEGLAPALPAFFREACSRIEARAEAPAA
jgi:predicted Zn-dependent protease